MILDLRLYRLGPMGIVFWLLIHLNLYSQETLFVNEQLFISSDALLTINGGVYLSAEADVINDGKMVIRGRDLVWQNDAAETVIDGSGVVHFKSNGIQSLGGLFGTRFSNLILENSHNIHLNASIEASVTLRLINTRVMALTNKLVLSNSDPRSLKGTRFKDHSRSMIDGVFERNIGEAGRYYFPIGSALKRHGMVMEFDSNSSPERIGASFDTDMDEEPMLDITESGEPYIGVTSKGFWNLNRTLRLSETKYNLFLETSNLDEPEQKDDNHAPLLLSEGAWDCVNCGVGVGVGPNGTPGRTRSSGFSKRMGLNLISDITIGRIGVKDIKIFGNDLYCPDDTGLASLSATEGFDSYLWSNGTTSYQSEIPLANGFASVEGFNSWGLSSTDVFAFDFHRAPFANDDKFEVFRNKQIMINALANDNMESNTVISIIEPPANGSIEIAQNGSWFNYLSDESAATSDQFTYQLCNAQCETACTTARVLVDFKERHTVIVPNGLTPNNDGLNDVFEITGLEDFEENTLEILDRRGHVVYAMDNYQNDWGGLANRSVIGGEILPDGTYFYLLKVKDRNSAVPRKFSGFIHLQR